MLSGDGLERESLERLTNRCLQLLMWLKSRPEKVVVVSCHSAILCCMTNAVLEVLDEGERSWFGTGEMRTMEVVWQPNPELQQVQDVTE